MEKYKERFPDFYEFVRNILSNQKISHAYLIATSVEDALDVTIDFARTLLIGWELNDAYYSNTNVKNGNCVDLRIVQAGGQSVKKEDIVELKSDLKNMSVNNSRRIYIINEADKLNKSSGNMLLKTIEEPECDVIAILLTCNANLVLPTILSRCQQIYLKDVSISTDNHLDLSENDKDLIEFINMLESEKLNSLAYINKYIKEIFIDRTSTIEAFNTLIKIYSKYLEYYIYQTKNELLNDDIISKNDATTISKKIKYLDTGIVNLKYNSNIKLTIYKFIVSGFGGN